MAELLQSYLTPTDVIQPVSIDNLDIYAEYANELQQLHQISLQPDEQLIDNLLGAINALTEKTNAPE